MFWSRLIVTRLCVCGTRTYIRLRKDNKMSLAALRQWWLAHRTIVFRGAVLFMALVALYRLGNELSRLLWEVGPVGAIDLRLRHIEVHGWFAGRPVYRELVTASYPPATYVILWPFLGWLAFTAAWWLWAATTAIALGWCAYLAVRESSADTVLERGFIALFPFSMYATSAAIQNGQLVVHLLPLLIAGYTLLSRREGGWREDLFAGLLIVATLVSPTIAAPFFWIALFVPATLRPALVVVLGYVALTLLAASFQETSFVSLLLNWRTFALNGAIHGARKGGYANWHSWLVAFGATSWNLPISLLTLAALGVWTYRHRCADLWLLLGVTAIVARMWTYHRIYDDLLMLLPMVTLFRLAKRSAPAERSGVIAGVLLAIAWIAALTPTRLLRFSALWNWLFRAEQPFVWIAILIFLLNQTRQEKKRRLTRERNVSVSL